MDFWRKGERTWGSNLRTSPSTLQDKSFIVLVTGVRAKIEVDIANFETTYRKWAWSYQLPVLCHTTKTGFFSMAQSFLNNFMSARKSAYATGYYVIRPRQTLLIVILS